MDNTLIRTAAVLVLAAPLAADDHPGRETFSGFAVRLADSARPTTTSHVKITVDRWSTADDRRRLSSAFAEGGDDALLRELRKLKPLGRLSTPDSIGYDLRYAAQTPLASGGRRIVIATDRPLGYWEQANRTRSSDYPYTFIEMRIGAAGKGEGKMTIATRVNSLGEDGIELENYENQPVTLSNITASRK